MTDQHRATDAPKKWNANTMPEDMVGCIVELRSRIESLEKLHTAVVELNERFNSELRASTSSIFHLAAQTSRLGHRIEALEAAQHAHIEAKAAEAATRCAVEQMRSRPGSWQPIRGTTTYDEARDHARRMVRNIGSAPETVEGSFEMNGKSYVYKAYSEPAAKPPASQFTAKYLFTACNIVQDSFCYDPDGYSVWFETDISHSVVPGDNIKIAHHWGEAPDSKCCSTINYKVLSISETEIRSLRVRAISDAYAFFDPSLGEPYTEAMAAEDDELLAGVDPAADAQQLTLVERVTDGLAYQDPDQARGAIRQVAAAALQMHPDPNLTWERVALWLEQEASR